MTKALTKSDIIEAIPGCIRHVTHPLKVQITKGASSAKPGKISPFSTFLLTI